MPQRHDLWTIGELARRAGRRPSSIRYYEQIGLLPEPVRLYGQRRYDADAARRLAVIDTAQRAGLALDEIRALFEAAPGGDSAAVERLRQVAERKLPEVTAMIERSLMVADWLRAAARCECPSLSDCCLFDDAVTHEGQVPLGPLRSAGLVHGDPAQPPPDILAVAQRAPTAPARVLRGGEAVIVGGPPASRGATGHVIEPGRA